MKKAQKSKGSECTLLELRAQLSDVMSRVKVSGDPIVITQYAKPQVAMVSLDDLALIQSIKKK